MIITKMVKCDPLTVEHDPTTRSLVCFNKIYVNKIHFLGDLVAFCHPCITIYVEQSLPLVVYWFAFG